MKHKIDSVELSVSTLSKCHGEDKSEPYKVRRATAEILDRVPKKPAIKDKSKLIFLKRLYTDSNTEEEERVNQSDEYCFD
uniref:Uncharacterized protein n=1 Tax=Heterorhabditis bacteriophora TaxID=37862 RepID=A0A1I7WDZ4_HETBA